MTLYVINVCPEHNGACVGHDHEPATATVIPVWQAIEMAQRILMGDDRGEAQLAHLKAKLERERCVNCGRP